MKEAKLKSSGAWGYITSIVIAAMLCGTAIFVSIQYTQTQKEAASTQAQAAKDSANTIKDGLNDLGKGICNGHNTQFSGCRY